MKRKLGLLLMVLVLALGSLGVGYAAWTDTITVNGTVNTGSVDLDVVRYSGTYVYKSVADHGVLVYKGWLPIIRPADGPDRFVVAYAIAGAGAEENSVVMEFDNLFPGEIYCADFLVHYVGTVPAIVGGDIKAGENSAWLEDLWNMGKPDPDDPDDGGAWVEVLWSDETGAEGNPITDLVQMHYCNYAIVRICIKIPQDNDYQGLRGTFSGEIVAVNWNEANHFFGDN